MPEPLKFLVDLAEMRRQKFALHRQLRFLTEFIGPAVEWLREARMPDTANLLEAQRKAVMATITEALEGLAQYNTNCEEKVP